VAADTNGTARDLLAGAFGFDRDRSAAQIPVLRGKGFDFRIGHTRSVHLLALTPA
jgi:hypothetical protein